MIQWRSILAGNCTALLSKRGELILRLVIIGILFAFSITSINCASIVHGPRQKVSISSEPVGARIEIHSISRKSKPQIGQIVQKAVAPCNIELKRNSSYIAIIHMDGYSLKQYYIASTMWDKWLWIGTLIPLGPIVDIISGSAYYLSPDDIHAKLNPLPKSMIKEESGIIQKQYFSGVLDDRLLPPRKISKISIAIIGLDYRNIEKDEAMIITDILRRELFKSNYFEITDRATMEAVLEQQNVQISECFEQSCSIELGRMLAVEKVAFGSVSKLGKSYILEVAIADVETGKLIAAEGHGLICDIESIPELVENVAKKLALHFARND
jgi:hypothetical protein